MDEILRQPRQNRECDPAPRRSSKRAQADWRDRLSWHTELILDRTAIARRGLGQVLHRVLSINTVGKGRVILPFAFLLLSIAAAAIFVVQTVYTPAYLVTVDGIELGVVLEPTVFDSVVERVEARASNILGYDYQLEAEIVYESTMVERDKISPLTGFEPFLFNRVGEVMKTYVLTVDGEFIGASVNRAELEGLLARLQEPYLTEYTTSAGFVPEVRISYEYTASDVMQDLDAMWDTLSSTLSEDMVYTAVKGDTYSGIAFDNDMSLGDLVELNPGLNLDRLMIGDEVLVKESVPYLAVTTVERQTYHEVLASPVERVKDSTMYQGTTKVLEEGTEGEALVTADIAFLNGREQERTVLESVTLVEPTTRVIAEGTMPRPATMPKGYFIWPVYGRITSYFGYRSIFGTYSYHSGIDIATSYGTTIVAADGGTVTFSGYKGTYGYLVIISHGDGLQTYYAHCSSLLVSAGQKVYQGQAIGRVGSTGRSTGNHCHFEIKVNGTSVNPLSYLK